MTTVVCVLRSGGDFDVGHVARALRTKKYGGRKETSAAWQRPEAMITDSGAPAMDNQLRFVFEFVKKRKQRECHGATGTRLYHIWQLMLCRCGHSGKGQLSYTRRGIKVCPEWLGSFASFRSWAHSEGYDDSLTIDRRDGMKGYAPNNCRFVSWAVNARNRSTYPNTRKGLKLTLETAKAIRALLNNGGGIRATARQFGLDHTTVMAIRDGKVWRE